jgi:hypothetical protein
MLSRFSRLTDGTGEPNRKNRAISVSGNQGPNRNRFSRFRFFQFRFPVLCAQPEIQEVKSEVYGSRPLELAHMPAPSMEPWRSSGSTSSCRWPRASPRRGWPLMVGVRQRRGDPQHAVERRWSGQCQGWPGTTQRARRSRWSCATLSFRVGDRMEYQQTGGARACSSA